MMAIVTPGHTLDWDKCFSRCYIDVAVLSIP